MKRSAFFAAAALFAGAYAFSWAAVVHHPGAPAASAIADRCDVSKIRERLDAHNNAMLLMPGLVDKRGDPAGIIFPPSENAMKTTYLCQRGAMAVWKLLAKDAFNAAKLDEQVKLIAGAVGDLRALDEKAAALRAKAKEIRERAQEYQATGAKAPSAARQQELLALLIKANGQKLPDAKAPYAARTAKFVSGGTLLEGADGFYAELKKVAEVPAVARSIKKDWAPFINGSARNDHDGQAVSREMMRVLWSDPQNDAFKENAKFGAFEGFDRDLGKELRGLFYGVREDLNAVNQAVIARYGDLEGARKDLEAKAAQEKLAALDRESKVRGLQDKIAHKTAEEIFDRAGKKRSETTVEQMDNMVSTVRSKMAAEKDQMVVTGAGMDKQGKTLDKKSMPMPEASQDEKAFNDKAKEIADYLMQDKDVQAKLGAAGAALDGGGEPAKDASKMEGGKDEGKSNDGKAGGGEGGGGGALAKKEGPDSSCAGDTLAERRQKLAAQRAKDGAAASKERQAAESAYLAGLEKADKDLKTAKDKFLEDPFKSEKDWLKSETYKSAKAAREKAIKDADEGFAAVQKKLGSEQAQQERDQSRASTEDADSEKLLKEQVGRKVKRLNDHWPSFPSEAGKYVEPKAWVSKGYVTKPIIAKYFEEEWSGKKYDENFKNLWPKVRLDTPNDTEWFLGKKLGSWITEYSARVKAGTAEPETPGESYQDRAKRLKEEQRKRELEEKSKPAEKKEETKASGAR